MKTKGSGAPEPGFFTGDESSNFAVAERHDPDIKR